MVDRRGWGRGEGGGERESRGNCPTKDNVADPLYMLNVSNNNSKYFTFAPEGNRWSKNSWWDSVVFV